MIAGAHSRPRPRPRPRPRARPNERPNRKTCAFANTSICLPTGSHGEYWGTPGRLGDTLDGDTQESCTSYNLLKLDRHLLGWEAAIEYADHYERLFFNGILSTMNVNRVGALIYMLPLSTVNGSAKGFGDPLYSMTCCLFCSKSTAIFALLVSKYLKRSFILLFYSIN